MKRQFKILVAVFALSLVSCSSSPTSRLSLISSYQPTSQQVIPDGTYKIRNAKSGLCMDIPSGSCEFERRLITFICNNGNNQRFNVTFTSDGDYTIFAAHSRLALEGFDRWDTPLQQNGWKNSINQRWRIIDYGKFVEVSPANEPIGNRKTCVVEVMTDPDKGAVREAYCSNPHDHHNEWVFERTDDPGKSCPGGGGNPGPTPLVTSQILDASGPCTPVQGFHYSNCVLKVRNKSDRAIVATFQWTGIGIPPHVNGKVEKKDMAIGPGQTVEIQTAPFPNPPSPALKFLCTKANYKETTSLKGTNTKYLESLTVRYLIGTPPNRSLDASGGGVFRN